MRRHHKENLDDYILEEDFQTFLADIFQLLLLSTLFTMKGPHGVLNTGTSLTAQRETAATLHHLNKDEKPYCTHGKKKICWSHITSLELNKNYRQVCSYFNGL